jgi:hypothetical protein
MGTDHTQDLLDLIGSLSFSPGEQLHAAGRPHPPQGYSGTRQ